MKYKSPGCPTIYIVIGDQFIPKALHDLGASVNLLPFTEYERLELGELKPTKMVIQLANRSTRLPRVMVEDVLIRLGEFYYPTGFVVLETKKVVILLARSLLFQIIPSQLPLMHPLTAEMG